MERYDYMEAVTNDVRAYMADVDLTKYEDKYEAREALYDELWVCDSVTGNASGSYTCNAWQAEEYVCHNLDLLGEALEVFGGEYNVIEHGAEWCDVTIRCYLLPEAIDTVLNEMWGDDD